MNAIRVLNTIYSLHIGEATVGWSSQHRLEGEDSISLGTYPSSRNRTYSVNHKYFHWMSDPYRSEIGYFQNSTETHFTFPYKLQCTCLSMYVLVCGGVYERYNALSHSKMSSSIRHQWWQKIYHQIPSNMFWKSIGTCYIRCGTCTVYFTSINTQIHLIWYCFAEFYSSRRLPWLRIPEMCLTIHCVAGNLVSSASHKKWSFGPIWFTDVTVRRALILWLWFKYAMPNRTHNIYILFCNAA